MEKTKDEYGASEGEFTSNEGDAGERQEEEEALIKVFEDVRQKSRQGLLAQPSDWVELDFIPSHMDSEEFEKYVYAYLEEYLHQMDPEAKAEQVKVFRSSSTAVGVPQIFRAPKEEQGSKSESFDDREDGSEDAFEQDPSTQDPSTQEPCTQDQEEVSDKEFIGQSMMEEYEVPPGYELVELEGELTLLAIEDEVLESYCDCSGIVSLVGKEGYYLYDEETMTSTYARWAFLSAEDDRIATFVECVRNESKVYPRPMAATGFKNEPFSFSTDEIVEIWQVVSESQEYPDLQITSASNGAVYFFSTNYLTPVYAASLAEWEAVERKFHL